MKYRKYPQRDDLKNYFSLPNEIYCLGLCSGEVSVYSYLLYCEVSKTFQCWPSYKTIGNALKMSRNTVKKYVKMLEGKRLITTEYTDVITKKGIKHNGNLKYTLLPIHEALKYLYQRQLEKTTLEQAKLKVRKKLEKHERNAVGKGYFG